jgi:hypothetical protein
MNFDENTQEFVLEAQDFAVLNLPRELDRYSMSEANPLIEAVAQAQTRVEGIDETEYPLSSNRAEVRASKLLQQRILGQIKNVLAEHVAIDASGIDTFFEE